MSEHEDTHREHQSVVQRVRGVSCRRHFQVNRCPRKGPIGMHYLGRVGQFILHETTERRVVIPALAEDRGSRGRRQASGIDHQSESQEGKR